MNPKILIIDDEGEFAKTLAERLELRGFIAKCAFDGEGGLMEFEKWKPDFVILDIMMPGMSGLEVLKRIRNIPSEVPILLLTGHGTTRDGIESMKLGAVDFVMKPVDINELIAKIRETITLKER